MALDKKHLNLKMKIKSDHGRGIATLTPATPAEATLLRGLVALGKNAKLDYDGRSAGRYMSLHFLSKRGKRLTIVATDDESDASIRGLRDALFFGGQGLTVLGCADEAGPSLEVCCGFCKHCGTPLIERGRCEFRTCEDCVAKCEHDYKTGYVHGGPAEVLSNGEYCGKCGRGRPDSNPEVLIRHGETKMMKMDDGHLVNVPLGQG